MTRKHGARHKGLRGGWSWTTVSARDTPKAVPKRNARREMADGLFLESATGVIGVSVASGTWPLPCWIRECWGGEASTSYDNGVSIACWGDVKCSFSALQAPED